MNVNAERVAVQSSEDLELELELSDSEGRVFDNITSILMEWTASPASLSYFVNKDSVFAENLKEKVFIVPHRHYQASFLVFSLLVLFWTTPLVSSAFSATTFQERLYRNDKDLPLLNLKY